MYLPKYVNPNIFVIIMGKSCYQPEFHSYLVLLDMFLFFIKTRNKKTL